MIGVADFQSRYQVRQWSFVFENFDLFGEWMQQKTICNVDFLFHFEEEFLMLKKSETNLMVVSIAI